MPKPVNYYSFPAHYKLAIAKRIAEIGEENVKEVRFYPPDSKTGYAGAHYVVHQGARLMQAESANGEPPCDDDDPDCFPNFTRVCPPVCE